ncbi:MAG: GNAT family N-acetyltransferase [Caldilineaceae bacterium]|nr:GNAT family N-acetyltransferase [Caldilineaceae bacterium]
MIEIAFLADHLEAIPLLTRWFRAQWPDYYAERTAADIAQDFYAEAQREGLPVRLVALRDGQLAGTITLREEATWTLPEYRPGLGGLLVTEQQRGQGVGTKLVRAGMKLALAQGYATVYATTVNARGILERLGWKLVKEVSHGDERLLLYGCDLKD